jgi:membrane-associated phospholipid phosphatase
LGLEAIGHSQLIVFIMKEATQRERPQTDEARKGFWRGGDSFPSGHAAGSFALASVFAYEYRDHIAVPITAYTLATAVSLSRMSARKHWFSDVFVGGSMGFLIGRYVYKTHHNPDLPGSPVHNRFSRLMPEFGVSDRGLTLQWKL